MTTQPLWQESRPFRVLQLTDPHLKADRDCQLFGINTRDSLTAVIDDVLKHGGQPDLVLATGDLAQDGSHNAYEALAQSLARFDCDSLWIPGNHDNADRLWPVAQRYRAERKHLKQNGWQILMLDSSVPGKVHGELTRHELEWLDATLTANGQLPALIALHHHAVDITANWMADIGLHNRDAFWAIINRHPQVRVVTWGHIHQEVDRQENGVRLLGTPSTCIQFTAGAPEFSVEERAPGYRWFELGRAGAFTTRVHRALDFKGVLNRNSGGY
ncbi:MAG TPA: 3',5'-cyclic-AMP phosphodiesterase [Marinobacter sp.]|nr:3',5'-cyclic-AMP phosphodiesterase [Marinobacter sp.]